jgi:DNA-binding transcriptional LysR family regulator
VVAHRLTSARRLLCASPFYFAHAGVPAAPAELARHDCLTYRRAAEPAVWAFRDASGEATVRVTGPLQSNSGEVLRAAANDGLGLVLLPDWMVAADLANGRLRTCLDGYEAYPPLYREPIFAVHRRGAVPAKVSVFIAHLKEMMGVAEPSSRKSGK